MPLEVIEDVAKNLTDYEGCGQSVMEMSHRSEEFKKILADAEDNLREIMKIPDNYKVLFLQGGATLQFTMVALNLMTEKKKAQYIVTGTWAKKAAVEAGKYGEILTISSEEDNYAYIPKFKSEDLADDVDYVHVTYNNTIYGSHYNEFPDVGDRLLVADMSSNILSEEIDVSKFALIYAGAQKNIGPAGVTIVIVREDLIGKAADNIPVYLDYKIHAEKGSAYNTPPCFPIYVAGEVFKKIKKDGGVSALEEKNIRKANKLYDYLDSTDFYRAPIVREDRSLMNVVFATGDPDLDKKFVAEAAQEGMVNLKGHRSTGGMRASIYNAMPEEGVDKLIGFMKKFEAENR